MVGQALADRLRGLGHEVVCRRRTELDLMDQRAVGRFFAEERIDQVYLAAFLAHDSRYGTLAQYQQDYIYQPSLGQYF